MSEENWFCKDKTCGKVLKWKKKKNYEFSVNENRRNGMALKYYQHHTEAEKMATKVYTCTILNGTMKPI